MKPRSLIARSTLRLVGSLTVSGRLSTFETVPTDTPARLATSLTPVVADLTCAFRGRPDGSANTVALKGFKGRWAGRRTRGDRPAGPSRAGAPARRVGPSSSVRQAGGLPPRRSALPPTRPARAHSP